MFQAKSQLSQSGRIEKYRLFENDHKLTFRQVVNLWKSSETFRTFYTETLNASRFEAFFWETPPITIHNFDRDFEFILMESKRFPMLSPDTESFKDHFSKNSNFKGVLTFPNLGKNAILVVPKPVSKNENYVHLAKFLRTADDWQIHNLWQSLAEAIEQRLNEEAVWISTAGMGVYWLHIRLDNRPKYYRFEPNKTH